MSAATLVRREAQCALKNKGGGDRTQQVSCMGYLDIELSPVLIFLNLNEAEKINTNHNLIRWAAFLEGLFFCFGDFSLLFKVTSHNYELSRLCRLS